MFSPHMEVHSSRMLCQTHGLNWHIHPHTALPTGKYAKVRGFSYYTQSYSSDIKPAAVFPPVFFFFCPKFVFVQVSVTLKGVLQKC